jgi:hypothetical protein
MNGRGGAVAKLAAAMAITGSVWLLARQFRRRGGRGPDASAREDGQGSVPAPARTRMRDDGTRQERLGVEWDIVDEASAQSFPASDPPGYYPLSL